MFIVDGNKRVALLAMFELADRNDIPWESPTDQGGLAQAIEDLAAHNITEEQFVNWVR